MKAPVLSLLCAAQVALAGVANVNSKRCNANDKSCYSRKTTYSRPDLKFYNKEECIEQVARGGIQACRSFLRKIVNRDVLVERADVTLTSTVTVTTRPTVYAIFGGPVGYIDYSQETQIDPEDVPMPNQDRHRYLNPPQYPETSSTTTTTTTTAITTATTTTNITPITSITPRAAGRRYATPLPESNNAINRFKSLPNGVPIYASSCARGALYAEACYNYYGVMPVDDTAVDRLATTAAATQTAFVTVTQAAPTTSTVCDPLNSYGYIYRDGYNINSRNQRGLALVYPSFDGITSLQPCCAQCFQTRGCLIWFLDANNNGVCTFYMQVRGTSRETTTLCPAGLSSVFSYTSRSETATFGIGPCGQYAGTPDF